MAPSATVQSAVKIKRPLGIQTSGINGINSRTSSPSPSISAGRLPASATSNNGPRSAKDRPRRDGPPQLLGRGQRNNSVGLRSASIAGDPSAATVSEQPYVKSDEYILKKFRGHPPSLILHLHPTHFRFDQQEGSFTYTSPMKIVLEHIRERTIPHDLVEFMQEVPFYEGCMIVQIHDHKSLAPSQEKARANTGVGKAVPFSIHNYNVYLTPSPYVPFTQPNVGSTKKKETDSDDVKVKSMEQKDKENMPAPSLPNDVKRNVVPTKKVYSVVLRPTPLGDHIDLVSKAGEARAGGRRESRQDPPLSATVPATPSSAVPPTPHTGVPPPAKRVKKSKLDNREFYSAEAQILLATTAPLCIEPVRSSAESAALLEVLAHPMHAEKPPSPKTRKRTVAEMAADEAAAAEQERFMLICDERLSGLAIGAKTADGNGQAPFEPRFERFQILETIKLQHEENKRLEKLRKEEADRKQQQETARNKLAADAEKREQEKARVAQMERQAAVQRQAHLEAQRRVQAQQAQQMGGPVQHAHPPNGLGPNGMAAQPQRFHNQQVSQNQTSSPIIRNGTPQSHSSPTVNGMGMPMQQSTSSMGGSPPRPGSVAQQAHPMGAPAGHANNVPMQQNRSQQSHAGTPRMPHSTPNVQATPLNRQMSQTPRMSQSSPQGTMPQTPSIMQMNSAQAAAAAAAFQQQQQQAANIQKMRMMQQMSGGAAIQGIGGMMQGPQPNQQQIMQAQMMRAQQLQQQGMNQGMSQQPNYSQQLQAQMAAMSRSGGMQSQNFMQSNPNMQQMQQIQQIQQMQQMQMRAMQQGQPIPGQQPMTQQQAMQRQLMQIASTYYNQQKQAFLQQNPSGMIPPEIDSQLRHRAHQHAQVAFQRRREMMAQQGAMQNMNGMQNGMGM